MILFFVLLSGFSVHLFTQPTRPPWIDIPYSTYSKENYLVAVGEGFVRLDAENAAFANLVKIFGTRVKLDARSITRMSMENQGSSDEVFYMESSSEQNIGVTAFHDIENVSIAEVWQDLKTKKWSALAILPRQQSAQVFAKKIADLNIVIQGYLDKAEYKADLLYKFSLVDMAAIYAQECENLYTYYNILSPRIMQNEHNYRQLRAEADSILKNITFSIDTQESNPLTQLAIIEMLGTRGMRIGAIQSDYVFKETLSYTGTDTGFGMYLLNYILTIELLDAMGNRLSVFTFKGKEGGLSEAQAVQILRKRLANDILNGSSELQIDSLLVQFTAFLDNYLQ